MTPSDQSDLHRGLDRLKEQLIRLDRERADTKHQINELTQRLDRVVVVADEEPEASAPLTSKAKVALFASLFRGRQDLVSKRWDNARTDKYENLLKAGVIDPTKVTRIALENAASIASMLLTTECVIAEEPEDPAAHSHAPAGMGGGMPGMM